MRSLIDIVDFSVEELNELLVTACDISENPEKYWDSCKHKKLATLFFEPSTRTRLSFEAAMLDASPMPIIKPYIWIIPNTTGPGNILTP